MNESDAYRVGEVAGELFVYVVLLGAAFGVGFYLARKQPTKRLVWWPVVVATVLLAATLIGRSVEMTEAASAKTTEAVLPPMYVQKRVGRNFAGQNIRLTADLLPFQETDARKLYFEKLEAQHVPVSELRAAKVKSELLRIGENSVIRTTFQLPGRHSVREFLGILGDMETTVVCVQEGTEVVLFDGTPCEREVRDVFGPAAIEVVK